MLLYSMRDQILESIKELLKAVLPPQQSININIDAHDIMHEKKDELITVLEKTTTSSQKNNVKLLSKNKILEEKITTIEKCCEAIIAAFTKIDDQADLQKELDDKLKKWNKVLEESERLSHELE